MDRISSDFHSFLFAALVYLLHNHLHAWLSMLLQLSFPLRVIPILQMFIKRNNCIGADQATASKVESPRTIGVEKTTNSNSLVWCQSNSDLRASIHQTKVEKTIFSEWRLEKLRRRSSRLSLRWSGPLDFGVEKEIGEAEKTIFSIESPPIDRHIR